MPNFRDIRNVLLVAMDDGYLSDDEFGVMFDAYKSRNYYTHWKYEPFDLNKYDDAATWSLFRFFKNDIRRLKDVLRLPDTIITYNRMRVDGIEALCIFLKRIAYPCRYVDLFWTSRTGLFDHRDVRPRSYLR